MHKDHIIFTAAQDINEICSPLKDQLEVFQFGYNRLFNDGSEIDLGTRPELIENYREKELHRYGAYWSYPGNYQTGFVIWSHLNVHTEIANTRERFQIGDGITYIHKLSDGVEFFHFATALHNQNMISFYLNNLDLFEKFSLYFKQKASKLISKAEEDKYFISDRFSENHCIPLKNETLRLQFLNNIQLNNHSQLSKRQFACLYYLAKGMTLKQIALTLELSPKTVENYFNIVKSKLFCSTRAELVAKALKMKEIRENL